MGFSAKSRRLGNWQLRDLRGQLTDDRISRPLTHIPELIQSTGRHSQNHFLTTADLVLLPILCQKCHQQMMRFSVSNEVFKMMIDFYKINLDGSPRL